MNAWRFPPHGAACMDFCRIHDPAGAPMRVTVLIPLAKSGKIGLSDHNLAEVKETVAVLEKEGPKISAIQNHFSIPNRSCRKSKRSCP